MLFDTGWDILINKTIRTFKFWFGVIIRYRIEIENDEIERFRNGWSVKKWHGFTLITM